jgi:hypothetical protein
MHIELIKLFGDIKLFKRSKLIVDYISIPSLEEAQQDAPAQQAASSTILKLIDALFFEGARADLISTKRDSQLIVEYSKISHHFREDCGMFCEGVKCQINNGNAIIKHLVGLVGQIGFVGLLSQISLVSHIGLNSIIGLIGWPIDLVDRVGCKGHINFVCLVGQISLIGNIGLDGIIDLIGQTGLVGLVDQIMTKYSVMRECEDIQSWILYVSDLVFSHQGEIYGFKFPDRFLEISSRDLTLFLI